MRETTLEKRETKRENRIPSTAAQKNEILVPWTAYLIAD